MATLFEKVKFGKLELKNRLVMAPMGFSTSGSDGGLSERHIQHLVERARGGFGLIFSSSTFVSNRFDQAPLPNVLENYSQAVRVGLLADRVHQYDAKLCIQLSLGFGRLNANKVDISDPPRSASAVPSFWYPDLICKPFTKEEINFLVKSCGQSALMAMQAGADAIELNAVGGYVIDQFMNPGWNKRTDEYGGSLENRLRIVFEIRDEIWNTCGKDFPIMIKLTLDHHMDEGAHHHPAEEGINLEGGLEHLKALDDGGFTMLHLDEGYYYGRYHYPIPTIYQKQGTQIHLAEAAKAAGIRTPIIIQGKLGVPEIAEEVLREGKAELIALGHQSLADPDWPKKVKTKQLDDIIPCIGCNECIYLIEKNRPSGCTVNPLTGAEQEFILSPAKEHKRILVIGSGPAGMMSAITARQRGFEVEVWEKESTPGGMLLSAGGTSFKSEIMDYANYLIRKLNESGAEIHLGKEATAEEIIKRNPDAVILAAGAKPLIPPIPGIDGKNVKTAHEVFVTGDCGERVVIIGGGLVGVELALSLDQKGKSVTLVEMLDQVLLNAEHSYNAQQGLDSLLDQSNLTILTGTTVQSINESGITLSADGETTELPCNTVVIAAGYAADHSLGEALEGKVNQVFTIGDNKTPGRIFHAVHQAYHTVRLLEEL